VFGQRAGELHRHGPAGERHHAAAEALVQRIQGRGAKQRRGEKGQGMALRQRGSAAGFPAQSDPPLSRNLRDSGPHQQPGGRRYSVGAALWAPAFQRS
jgi:hypothetical protein